MIDLLKETVRKRPRKGRILKQTSQNQGYLYVNLGPDRWLVHTLILTAFICPRPLGYQGCHRNDVKTDNVLNNLYWGTRKENAVDAELNGRRQDYTKQAKGEQHHQSKLRESDIRFIRTNYKRGDGPELAKRFGVNITTVCKIARGETWKHI